MYRKFWFLNLILALAVILPMASSVYASPPAEEPGAVA